MPVQGGGVSPGRGNHVRQVDPDRNQATDQNFRQGAEKLQLRRKMKLATWNVRTLYQGGKLDNVQQVQKRLGINILGMSEVRWPGTGVLKKGGMTFVYSGGEGHKVG